MSKSWNRSHRRRRTTRRLVAAWAIALFLLAASWRTQAVAEFRPGEARFLAKRYAAEGQLERAREVVAKARSVADETRTQLDQFVGQHFEELRAGGETPPGVPEPTTSKPDVAARSQSIDATADVEAQWLKEQIQELVTQRYALLSQYTAAHPQVAGIALKISEFSQRLAAIARPKAGPAEPADAVGPRLVAQMTAQRERQQEAARQYQEIAQRWQIAEHNLKAAEDNEASAAEKLAAIDAAIAITAVNHADGAGDAVNADDPAAILSLPRRRAATADAPTVADRPRQGSSPLIAAAFLVALLVAAVAAVKLARATSDATFNSVDEAAAALALPLVGVIPRGASGSSTSRALAPMPRGVVVLGEVLVALFVFALVAYCMQNPDFLWKLCTDPLECFR